RPGSGDAVDGRPGHEQRPCRIMCALAVVAAIDMGYGHLRRAAALAGYLGSEVLQMDRAALGNDADFRFWESARELYEPLTRLSQLPGVGGPMRAVLNTITAIPEPWPVRDLSGPTQGTKCMMRGARYGVCT